MRNVTRAREILLDTNILRAYINQQDGQHLLVVQKLEQLQRAGYRLFIAPQCLYELWVVLTRPLEQNGLERTPEEANELLQALREVFELNGDPLSMVDEWQQLCCTYQIRGKRAHDARLVAWMMAHQVSELLTLNPDDFRAFTQIVVQTV